MQGTLCTSLHSYPTLPHIQPSTANIGTASGYQPASGCWFQASLTLFSTWRSLPPPPTRFTWLTSVYPSRSVTSSYISGLRDPSPSLLLTTPTGWSLSLNLSPCKASSRPHLPISSADRRAGHTAAIHKGMSSKDRVFLKCKHGDIWI